MFLVRAMNRDNKIKQPSLIEQLLPTEVGFMQSLIQSKTLVIMLVIFLILFVGLGLLLVSQ